MRISDWISDVCSSDLSPTLYAIAAGTVALKVVAGDVVKQGEPLAVIDSPELRSKLVQEESTLASMEAEASRAVLDAQIARAAARKVVQQAEISRTAAQRDLERYQRAYEGGAVSQNELRSEEHTSELQSLMRISYAVLCLKKNKT